MFLGLMGGPDPAGSTPGPDSTPLERLYYDLVRQWHPIVIALPGLAFLVAGSAAAILLLRSPVPNLYRPESRQQDPRWAAFAQAQQRRIDGEVSRPNPLA